MGKACPARGPTPVVHIALDCSGWVFSFLLNGGCPGSPGPLWATPSATSWPGTTPRVSKWLSQACVLNDAGPPKQEASLAHHPGPEWLLVVPQTQVHPSWQEAFPLSRSARGLRG